MYLEKSCNIVLQDENQMNKVASIVCVGNWNPKIFTPKWVSDNVFQMKEGEPMQIQLDEKQMTLSYIWNDIQFKTTERGIEFITNNTDNNHLKLMEKMFRHLYELLPFTPIDAF